MDALGYAKALLDPHRLAVAGLVALAPRTPAELATLTGLSQRDVLAALAPLVQGGVVERDGDAFRLVPEALRAVARTNPQPAPPDTSVLHGMTSDEQAVLGRFFRGHRLVEVPAQRTKRLVVLERLALEFEPGVRYPEPEVNAILSRFHSDYATLRRHLVDEGFLDREAGAYWRAGGRV
jgi:hypothetical protein